MNYFLAILAVTLLTFWLWQKYNSSESTEGKEETPTEPAHATTDSPKSAGKGEHPEKKKSAFEKILDVIFGVITVIIGISMALVAVLFLWWVFGKATAPAVSPYRDATQRTETVIGEQSKTYLFGDGSDRCVEVYLSEKWSDFPKGGRINFVDIETGRIVATDAPGEIHENFGLQANWYRICAAEKKTKGVVILQ